MPTVEEILSSLTAVSRALEPLAIAWHLAILAAVIAIIAGWRPSTRLGLLLVCAPVLSVSIVSLAYGNPFNGISLGALAIALAMFAGADRAALTAEHATWTTAVGAVLIAFGFTYPHFLDGPSYRYLYASPVGLVPCPTLAVVAGFTLVAGGFASRAVCAVLGGWTAFYALFGMFRLGVWLDAGLLVGSFSLLVVALRGVQLHSRRGAPGYSG